MSDSVRPLISIAIPTWNRAAILDGSLASLAATLQVVARSRPVAKQVEVVISDNGSEDATGAVVARWTSALPFPVRYHRNPVNIGVARNILGLLDLVRGRYFLFIGDDDEVTADGLRLLLSLAALPCPPAAMVQDATASRPLARKDFSSACRYFYDYGNAYMGCVAIDLARRAVRVYGLGERVSGLVWPQTAFGFLGIHLAGPGRHVVVAQATLGRSPHHGSLNIMTFSYYMRSFFDLVEVGNLVGAATGSPKPVRHLLAVRSAFLRSHILGMCRMALVDDVDRTRLRQRLAKFHPAPGIRIRAWSLAIRVLTLRPVGWLVLMLVAPPLTREWPWRLLRRVNEAREKRRATQAAVLPPGVRFGNYFDATAPQTTSTEAKENLK